MVGGPAGSELEVGEAAITAFPLADDPGRVAHPPQLVDRGLGLVGLDQQDGLGEPGQHQPGQRLPGQQLLGEHRLGGPDQRHVLVQLDGIRDGARLIGAGSGGSRKRVRRTRVRGSTGRFGTSHDPRGQLGLVEDLVAVALLGQEELAMVGEVHLAGVAGHQGVEARGLLALLGAEDPAQPLGFLLAAAERARDLDHHVGVGQVDGEVADLREDQPADRPVAEPAVEVLALGVRRLRR